MCACSLLFDGYVFNGGLTLLSWNLGGLLKRTPRTGLLESEVDNGDGTKTTSWDTAVPVATKVMVIGVAEFSTTQVSVGVPLS